MVAPPGEQTRGLGEQRKRVLARIPQLAVARQEPPNPVPTPRPERVLHAESAEEFARTVSVNQILEVARKDKAKLGLGGGPVAGVLDGSGWGVG